MSDGRVILDSNELRNFASFLASFNQELASDMSNLEAKFSQLGQTWRDWAYDSFASELDQTLNDLRRFEKASEEYIAMLQAKADRADAVHG